MDELSRASDRVILIGFMGSGKTTFGKQLARQLGYSFIDTDAAIEQKAQEKIPEIFATKGEAHFRMLESQLLDDLSSMKHIVIATGGGMPCFGDVLARLKAMGTTFYLQRPVLELANRLMNAKKKRPLIDHLSEEALVEYIENTLKTREVFYSQAHYTLDRNQQNTLFVSLMLRQQASDL